MKTAIPFALALALVAAPVAAQDKTPTKPAVEPERVSAAHILVSWKGAPKPVAGVMRSKDEARARAEEALAFARKADVAFTDAAIKYSDDPNAQINGGAIGVYPRGKLPPGFKAIEDAMFGMEEGQVSDIVETAMGFHILSRTPLVEYAAAHLLLMYVGSRNAGPEITRTREEAVALIGKLMAEARAPGADFAALARRHSDCPSKEKGGDLGIFGPGQMVPEFEAALSKLKEGEIAGPVETPFGYHLIRRLPIVRIGVSHVLVPYKGAERAADDVAHTKDEAKALAQRILELAKQPDADFGALARKYSSCTSAAKGGDLGVFERGKMVPEFDDAAFALKVGDIAFAETPFGFHVIKRTR